MTQLGSHSNIIEYFGINKFENNMYMIFEYAEKGDLKKQLELYRKNFKLEMSNSYLNKTKIAYEIANGMEYISNLDIVYNIIFSLLKIFNFLNDILIKVHKDLAARNVLLDNDFNCKIADFGCCKTEFLNRRPIR